MDRKVHIYPIESSRYNHQNTGDNWSPIVSELIRVTAHYCDNYLSDIFYDISAFVGKISEDEKYDHLLYFGKNGVHSFKYEDFAPFWKDHEDREARAFFRLEYDPGTKLQRLTELDCFVTYSY